MAAITLEVSRKQKGNFAGGGGGRLDKGKRRGKGDGEEMERRGMYGEIKIRGKGEEMERRERNKGKRRGDRRVKGEIKGKEEGDEMERRKGREK